MLKSLRLVRGLGEKSRCMSTGAKPTVYMTRIVSYIYIIIINFTKLFYI